MKELGVLLLVAIVAMGILLIILLRQITILKKQTEDIIQEVKAYVAYVMDEPVGQAEKEPIKQQPKRQDNEEAQSHLIQTILGEYFP